MDLRIFSFGSNVINKKNFKNSTNVFFKGRLSNDSFEYQNKTTINKNILKKLTDIKTKDGNTLNRDTINLYARIMQNATKEENDAILSIIKYNAQNYPDKFSENSQKILLKIEDEPDILKTMEEAYSFVCKNAGFSCNELPFVSFWTWKTVEDTENKELAVDIAKELSRIMYSANKNNPDQAEAICKNKARKISMISHVCQKEELKLFLAKEYYNISDEKFESAYKKLTGLSPIPQNDTVEPETTKKTDKKEPLKEKEPVEKEKKILAKSTPEEIKEILIQKENFNEKDAEEIIEALDNFSYCYYYTHHNLNIETPIATKKNLILKDILAVKQSRQKVFSKDSIKKYLEIISYKEINFHEKLLNDISRATQGKQPEEFDKIINDILDKTVDIPGFNEKKEFIKNSVELGKVLYETGKTEELLKADKRFNQEEKQEILEAVKRNYKAHTNNILLKLLTVNVNNQFVFSKDSIIDYIDFTVNMLPPEHIELLSFIATKVKAHPDTDKESIIADILLAKWNSENNTGLTQQEKRIKNALAEYGIYDLKDINNRDKNGNTLLMYLIKNKPGHFKLINYLLSLDNINPNIKNNQGKSPLLINIQHKHNDIYILRELVNNLKTNINIQDNNGLSILHELLYNSYYLNENSFKNRLDLIFSRKDLNVNIQDNNGNTPLLLLCKLKKKFNPTAGMLKKLLSRDDTDLNIKNNNGNTAIIEALRPTYYKHQRLDNSSLSNNEFAGIYNALTTPKFNNILKQLDLNIINYSDKNEIKEKLKTDIGRFEISEMYNNIMNDSTATQDEKDVTLSLKKLAFEGTQKDYWITKTDPRIAKVILTKPGVDLSMTDENGDNLALKLAEKYSPELVPLLLEYMEKGYCESLKDWDYYKY